MRLLLLLLITTNCLRAAIQSDGTGFFPVIVMVMRSDGVNPIQGASVRLADLPAYHETELDPEKQIQIIPATLGKPSLTDAKGCAVVFFHGNWGSLIRGDVTTYSHSLVGTLVVEGEKLEPFRLALKVWAKENGYSPQAHGAPFITVVLKPK